VSGRPGEADDRRSEAWRTAVSGLAGVDLHAAAQKGGFDHRGGPGKSVAVIPCFGRSIRVELPEGRVSAHPDIDLFSLKVLAMRYAARADGFPVTGEWVAYRELPGGLFYAATIPAAVEQPLAEAFGWERGSLSEAASRLGGAAAGFGDESFVFRAYPRVPLLAVLHWGDEEFPPAARVLFDRCCSHYLNTDDLKVLATQLAALLLRLSGRDYRAEDNLLWMVD